MKKTLFFVALATAMGFNNAQAVDWNWNGDIRYRYQSENATNDVYSKDRYRLRVRFGVNPEINDELSTGIRLATDEIKGYSSVDTGTGTGTTTIYSDTTSRNQTLTGGFTPKTIWLDEAYINYHPKFFNGNVDLLLGKRDVAKTLFVEKDLVWDSDLTFEGATLQYGKAVNGSQKNGIGAILGTYQLYNPGAGRDAYLMAAQLAYKGKASSLGYDLGASYYDYVHFHVDNTGGKLGIGPAFDYTNKDFNIVEFFGSVGGDLTKSVPWKLYGQYAFNTANQSDWSAIDNSQRNAFLVGLKLGNAKNPGQFEGSAEYVRIERDAVTVLTDGDRNNGSSTNLKGFKLSAGYKLIQNMNVGLTYFNCKDIVGAPAKTHQMLQADVVASF